MLRTAALLCCWLAASVVYAGQNVVVVLDDSGSMMDRMSSDRDVTKMEAAKKALRSVLGTLPPGAKVGIVLLNGRQDVEHWAYPLGPVDMARVSAAIEPVQPDASTPLGERLKTASDALLSLRQKERYGSYRLLAVTDGEATDRETMDAYLPDILSRGIWVDVIGVEMAGDHSLATKVQTYRRADDPASLEQAVSEVFAESTGSAGDADQSDFEVIAPLPDGVATAALQALAGSGNEPIGQRVSHAGQVASAGNVPPNMVYRTTAKGSLLGCSCFGVFILLLGAAMVCGVFFVLLTASRRR